MSKPLDRHMPMSFTGYDYDVKGRAEIKLYRCHECGFFERLAIGDDFTQHTEYECRGRLNAHAIREATASRPEPAPEPTIEPHIERAIDDFRWLLDELIESWGFPTKVSGRPDHMDRRMAARLAVLAAYAAERAGREAAELRAAVRESAMALCLQARAEREGVIAELASERALLIGARAELAAAKERADALATACEWAAKRLDESLPHAVGTYWPGCQCAVCALRAALAASRAGQP